MDRAVLTPEKLEELMKWVEGRIIPNFAGVIVFSEAMWRRARELGVCNFTDADLEAGFVSPEGNRMVLNIVGFGNVYAAVDCCAPVSTQHRVKVV